MFDIGWPEMMVVALVLIIVVGPKDLPRVLRTVAKWVSKARGMARDFQRSIDDIARQADLDDVRRDLNSIASPDISKGLDGFLDPTVSEGMGYPVEKQEQPAEEVAAPAAPAATPVSDEPVGPPPADDGTAAAPAEEALAVAQDRAEVSDEPPAERAAGA